jgi:3'-5' exoribonuclease
MKISEIKTKENKVPCDGVFGVKSRVYPTYYPGGAGGWKFDLTLVDETGEIRLTYFEAEEAPIRVKYDSIPVGEIVKVAGKVNIYRNVTAIYTGWRSARSLELANTAERATVQFIPASNQDPDVLFSYVKDTVDSMTEGPLKVLMNSFMDDQFFVDDFKTKPGAMKFHHACTGGLLEHTWEVLNHCKTTVEIHSSLKKDLVYAGAILHDIGKMRELEVGTGITSTEEGALLGHIHLSIEMVNEKIHVLGEFPSDLKNRLFHILLSHHEKLEYGSPVKAMTPEAITVASADSIGSKVSQYIRGVKDATTEDNKFYVRPIGWVYKD